MQNSIFNQFRQSQTPDFNSAYQSFMQNPMQTLSSKYNIPSGLHNDPQGIINHLLQSGQITQQQLSSAQQEYSQLFGNRSR